MPPDMTLNEDLVVDPEEQLETRIAWYYYVSEMTQQQIADRFGITRARVNRVLAMCRESGVVQIRINSKLATCVALEHQLEGRYGLVDAVVVPTPENESFIQRVLGVGAGPFLYDQLFEGCTVGIGWGRTLRHTVRSIRGRFLPSLSVVSLMGALTHGSGINTVDIAARFAKLFSADYYYLAAPVYTGTEESQQAIRDQDVIKEIYDRARSADLSLTSAGDLSEKSLMIELGLISADEVASLQAAGAVGDLIGHFLDKDGNEVDHPLNRRVTSLKLVDFGKIKKKVLVSGGPHKSAIIRAVLLRKLADVLVTDEVTAHELVADEADAAQHPTVQAGK